MKRHVISRLALAALAFVPAVTPACSCDDGTDGEGGNTSGTASGENGTSMGTFVTGAGGGGPCMGLECQIVQCGGGVKTTVSGKVYEPAGNVPLYNVTVYVPNAPLSPIADGASCDQCGVLSGDPIVTALTDATGSFVLQDVPVGQNIPLVIQVGKWRREVTLPSVTQCVDNPTTDGSLRLPRNQGEGHIPKIALTTGGADPLECWLRKIGIDDAEFTNPDGPGRVNLFTGSGGTDRYQGGASFLDAQTLWGTTTELVKYDVVLLACEGGQNPGTKPGTALQAMRDYTHAGGRVFASHWHNYWLEAGPDQWPNVAVFNHQPDLVDPFTARIDSSFPKGQALQDWLVNVGASTVPGELVINAGQHTVDAVTMLSTRWIYGDNPTSVQYLTFNTPIGVPVEQQCGRVVFSDIHVSSGDQVDQDFPGGCQTQGLSPQEKALLFMLFDLSNCLIPDDVPPEVPR
jgi:hypothetical protein